MGLRNDIPDAGGGLAGEPSGEASAVARLWKCLQAALHVEGVDRDACLQLRERLADGRFSVVVLGEFNRGKSSLINALLGAPVLPVGVVPLTSVITLIRHGPTPRVLLQLSAGGSREIAMEDLPSFVTEQSNRTGDAPQSVLVDYPSPWLEQGVRLVDTPGVGSIHAHNSAVTQAYLPQADAALFVASADQPVSAAETAFLQQVRHHAPRILCVLNKVDQLTADELRQSTAFTAAAVSAALGIELPVLAVSARAALQAQEQHDELLLGRSGLPALRDALGHLFGEERHRIWLESLGRGILRVLADAQLSAQLELQALSASQERLEEQLELFRGARDQAMRALEDNQVLVGSQAVAILKDRIEPQLAQFRSDLSRRVNDALVRFADAHPELSARALQDALLEQAVTSIRTEYERWRTACEDLLARELDRLASRHWAQVQQMSDHLRMRAADLFCVDFCSNPTPLDWKTSTDFRYKFWEIPDSLTLMRVSLLSRLPRRIAARWIVPGACRRAADLVDMQSGRVRHDVEERLKETADQLRRQLRAALELAVASIEDAVERASSARAKGSAQVSLRRAALVHTLKQIDGIEVEAGTA